MSETVSVHVHKPSFSPLRLSERTLLLQAVAVVLGTAFLAAASYISVPMLPVPVTMQTFAVTLIGALYGWRLGALTVAAWLLEGAVGMPVLSNGLSGLAYMLGTTGGYLVSFPIIAALTGWLAERGWNGQRPWLAFASALLANALCLAIGGLWLAAMIGFEKAVMFGVAPFIIGGILKSGLMAATLAGLTRVNKQNSSL